MNHVKFLADMKSAQKPAPIPTLEQATRYLNIVECNPDLLAYMDEKETLDFHQKICKLIDTNPKAARKLLD